jgi:hypothetical protein
LQVWWQTDETSPTQTESHVLLQQNESALQICVAHGSQVFTSFAPVVQIEWAQVPPPQL